MNLADLFLKNHLNQASNPLPEPPLDCPWTSACTCASCTVRLSKTIRNSWVRKMPHIISRHLFSVPKRVTCYVLLPAFHILASPSSPSLSLSSFSHLCLWNNLTIFSQKQSIAFRGCRFPIPFGKGHSTTVQSAPVSCQSTGNFLPFVPCFVDITMLCGGVCAQKGNTLRGATCSFVSGFNYYHWWQGGNLPWFHGTTPAFPAGGYISTSEKQLFATGKQPISYLHLCILTMKLGQTS